jgi:hypothetical protein
MGGSFDVLDMNCIFMTDEHYLVDFVLFMCVIASRLCSRYLYALSLYILRPKEYYDKAGSYLNQFFCVLLYGNVFRI